MSSSKLMSISDLFQIALNASFATLWSRVDALKLTFFVTAVQEQTGELSCEMVWHKTETSANAKERYEERHIIRYEIRLRYGLDCQLCSRSLIVQHEFLAGLLDVVCKKSIGKMIVHIGSRWISAN